MKKYNVCVLLSTYNGEKYLKVQLESLLKQKNVDIKILVRDDGSTDKTIDILEEYQAKGKLTWYSGENLKPAMSFMDLIYSVKDDFDYYAFCDQDDYWLSDKLEIACEKIEKIKNKYVLYYGRPRIVDEKLEMLLQPKVTLQRMTSFSESIVNSNATGCTMVFNNNLLNLLKKKTPDYIVMHDAWIHKVCLAIGGEVIFDEDVHILYRQHDTNVVGIKTSWLYKKKQHFQSIKNKNCVRSKTIKSLLTCYGDVMCEDYLELAVIGASYNISLYDYLRLLFSTKIKTKYLKRNVLFKLAVLFRAF